MKRQFLAALIGLAAVASSCARQARLSDAEQEALAREPVVVQVTNDNPLDVVVYLRVGNERRRLGLVTSGQTTTFPVEPGTIRGFSDVRIVIDPIGEGVEYTSDPVVVGPGESVEIRVGSVLQQTTVSQG